METYKYRPVETPLFTKTRNQAQANGLDLTLLHEPITLLAKGEPLPPKYQDRPLTGKMHIFRECNITDNWVLVYRFAGDKLILSVQSVGTHGYLHTLLHEEQVHMRRNVFAKSMLRQPIRCLFLVLLIGAATFAAVLRAAEFIIVRDEINRLEGYYRAVGVPWNRANDFGTLDFDEPAWQEIIEQSPYLDFADNRRTAIGYLTNTLNAYIMRDIMMLIHEERAGREYNITDAYFIGTLLNSHQNFIHGAGHYRFMYFYVDEKVAGYPELVRAGVEMRVTVPVGDINDPQHPALSMEEGGQYLLRGEWRGCHRVFIGSEYQWLVGWGDMLGLPPGGNTIAMSTRLDDYFALKIRPLESGTDVYFLPAVSIPTKPEWLERQLHDLDRNMRLVQLRTSMDMTAMYTHMPMDIRAVGGATPLLNLRGGRFINREDHETANPVAVIHWFFAEMRGLAIGDTLEIELQSNISGSYFGLLYEGHGVVWDENPHTLSLEIVGIVDKYRDFPVVFNHAATMRVYIPDSVLPPGYYYNFMYGDVHDNRYTFVLRSARYMDDFITTHGEALAAVGYEVRFVPVPGAREFFSATDSIMLVMHFNLVLFSVLAILIIILGAFIYTLLMRRNFAIMRSMGHSVGRTFWQMVCPVLVLWLPVMVVGAVAAWRVAVDLAGDTLAVVYEINETMLHMTRTYPGDLLLAGLVGVSVFIAVMSVMLGGFMLARRPILRLVQGR